MSNADLQSRAERAEAEIARLRTEMALQAAAQDKRILHKISILKLIFTGITALMAFLGVLVVINWSFPGVADNDGIGTSFFQTSKDILLVMSGILGSAMANVFDAKAAAAPEPPKPQEPSE